MYFFMDLCIIREFIIFTAAPQDLNKTGCVMSSRYCIGNAPLQSLNGYPPNVIIVGIGYIYGLLKTLDKGSGTSVKRIKPQAT